MTAERPPRRRTLDGQLLHVACQGPYRPAHQSHTATTVERRGRSTFYGNLLDGGLSPATVQWIGATLHRALRDARRRGRVVRNVADDAESPQVETPAMTVWSPEEVRRFLSHAREEDETLYPLFALVVSTGMRRGEALGLGWDAVDSNAGAYESRRHSSLSMGRSRPESRRRSEAAAQSRSTLRQQQSCVATRRSRRRDGSPWVMAGTTRGLSSTTGLGPVSDRVSKTFSRLAAACLHTADSVPRSKAHRSESYACRRRSGEGCQRATWSRDDQHHAGHLLAFAGRHF